MPTAIGLGKRATRPSISWPSVESRSASAAVVSRTNSSMSAPAMKFSGFPEKKATARTAASCSNASNVASRSCFTTASKLSAVVKQDLLATIDALEHDAAVRAVAFFSGKPENFIAGADIEEFVRLTTAAEAERLSAEGQEQLGRVARSPKPLAVGIHGACLGGGLEFALACGYRVASDHPRTQLGLPEVQLGILPGAGGCQRLPRLIGARAALDIILAGKVEGAKKAFRLGIVDELVHPAILKDVTIAAAQRMAGGWRPAACDAGASRLPCVAPRVPRMAARRQPTGPGLGLPGRAEAGTRADARQLSRAARRVGGGGAWAETRHGGGSEARGAAVRAARRH